VAASTLTLRDAFVGRSSSARTLAVIVGGAGLIAACAQISIPLGFTPIPVTGQTFAVLLVGAGLGSVAGTASTLLYVALGAIGLPIYAHHAHGWSVVTSSSGGYLVGFVIAAAVTGSLAEHRWDRRFSSSLGAMLTGNIVIEACGAGWLAHEAHLSMANALEEGVYPFVPGDILKMYLAAAALPAAWKLAGRRR
jgi:biotin transport system substrate-specific component